MTMKLNTIVLLLCAIICMASCSKNHGVNSELPNEKEVRCLCPPVIHLQPFGKFSQREAQLLGKELTKRIEDIFGVELECEVHPPLPLSDTLMNDGHWGVQGLSLIPGNACVASTFRVKDRRDFWKVVCHEFIHTYFTYNHCPKDDPSCLMQAAKGHPRYKGKNGLCPHCSNALKI